MKIFFIKPIFLKYSSLTDNIILTTFDYLDTLLEEDKLFNKSAFFYDVSLQLLHSTNVPEMVAVIFFDVLE